MSDAFTSPSAFARTLRNLLKENFVKNMMTFQISSILMMGTGLLSSIVYARLLGLEQFGLYALITAFAGLLGIVCTFGQETTFVTFLSEAFGRKSRNDIATVLAYFLQSTILALAVFIALMILAPGLGAFLRHDAAIGWYARWVILNMALQSVPTLVFTVLQIENKIRLVAILENCRVLGQFVVSTILLLMNFGVWALIFGTLTVSVIYVPLCIWMYHKHAPKALFPSLMQLIDNIGRPGTGTYFKQGLWIALDQILASNLYPNLFYVLLSSTASLEVIGLFRLAMRLAHLPVQILMSGITRLSGISIPKIASGARSELRRACIKLVKGTVALAALAVIGAAIVIAPLIPVVYGEAFRGAVVPFLIILPFTLISGLNVATVPIARIFRLVWLITIVNGLGLLFATGVYYWLLPDHSPLIAMSFAVLGYHFNSLILAGLLWQASKRGSRA